MKFYLSANDSQWPREKNNIQNGDIFQVLKEDWY